MEVVKALLLTDFEAGTTKSEVRLMRLYWSYCTLPPPLKKGSGENQEEFEFRQEDERYCREKVRRLLMRALDWQADHFAQKRRERLEDKALKGLKDEMKRAGGSEEDAELMADALGRLQETVQSEEKNPGDDVGIDLKIPDLCAETLGGREFLDPIREACEKMGIPFILPSVRQRANPTPPGRVGKNPEDQDQDCDDGVTRELMLKVSTFLYSYGIEGPPLHFRSPPLDCDGRRRPVGLRLHLPRFVSRVAPVGFHCEVDSCLRQLRARGLDQGYCFQVGGVLPVWCGVRLRARSADFRCDQQLGKGDQDAQ